MSSKLNSTKFLLARQLRNILTIEAMFVLRKEAQVLLSLG
ncbi:hypothetical protein CHCC20347_2437 [Bacillus paralicheniformis]|nr:hypothetical protein CHCC20347_2437 [Bacillus paralicheniformis]